MKIFLLNHNYKNIGTYFRARKIFELLKFQHQVTFICVSDKKFSLNRKIEYHDKSKIIYLPRIQYSKYFSGQLIRLIITTFYLLSNKIDIVYSFAFSQPQISIPSYIKKKISHKTRLIIDWDDLWGNGLGNEHNKLINSIFLFNENSLSSIGDQISCASKFLYRYSNQKFKKKIYFLPNFSINKLNENVIYNLNHEKKIEFLIIGNIYLNTLDYYLKLLDQLIFSGFPIQLSIIGYNKDDFYAQFGFKYRKYIIFHGKVFDKLKKNLIINGSSFFIMPTSPTKFDRSRFPIKFIEYLEFYKPIITNKSGEPARYLKKYDNGIVLSGNLNLDVQAIKRNINNSDSYYKLTSNYRKLYNENFSEGIIRNQINKIIDNV